MTPMPVSTSGTWSRTRTVSGATAGIFDEWDRALRIRGCEKPSRAAYAELPDWEERLGAYEWKLPEDLHPDNFVGDLASWWIEQHDKRWWNNTEQLDKPLFLQIGFPGPHPPYDPIDRYIDRYIDKDLPIVDPPEESLGEQPQGLQALRRSMLANNPDAIRHLEHPTKEQRHLQRAYYLANVTMIDEKIGQIIEALERNGYLENAVVVFTSDHGDSLGDHGHSQKWNMYDEVVRVPTLFWSPDRFPQGRTVTDQVELFDIGPTILELAGVEPRPWMEAVSLMPLITNAPEAKGREYVFAEHARDDYLPTIDFMTMVRGGGWKLVHFAGEREGQLFDLENDPTELHDLWNDPAHAGKKQELLGELREWLVRSNVKTHGWPGTWR